MSSFSFCKDFGKDKVMFVTKEDHATDSTVKLPPPEPSVGLIKQDGEINWSCPCLGGMATGPCNVEFRNAFSCFHYSEADPKGSDCYEAFRTMQDCFTRYPAVYNKSGGTADDDDDEDGMDIPNLSSLGGENNDPSEAKNNGKSIVPAGATSEK